MARSSSWLTEDLKRLLAGAACALLLAVLLYTWLASEPAPRTLVHLTFEDSLDNSAAIGLAGGARESQARYAAGKTGKALETLGEGGWIEIGPREPLTFGGSMEISFDFKRADWINPYVAGSLKQTMVDIQGRMPDRIIHFSFGLSMSKRSDPQLVVYVQSGDGEGHRLRAKDRPVTLGWHNVLVTFDRESEALSLYLDDKLVDRIEMTPALHTAGLDSIRFGTWYKRNQAYRGLIDNFIVRDTGG